jgi:hypothetical protein
MDSAAELLQFEVDESGHEIPFNVQSLMRSHTESISPWLMGESDRRIMRIGGRMRQAAASELGTLKPGVILDLARILAIEQTMAGPEFLEAVQRVIGESWVRGDVYAEPGAEVIDICQ